MNFARLNHILIPATKDGRDRFRDSRAGRVFRPLVALYLALSDEGRYLTVFALICGAAGLEVGATQIYLLWSLLTGVLIASLVARRFYRLGPARVSVEPPPRVMAGEVAYIPITVQNRGDEDLVALRVERPLLPWDGRYVERQPHLALVPAGGSARTVVQARFSLRGEHHLDPFHVGRLVPLGLALGPTAATGGVKFVVLPRIANVERIDLPMTARYQPGGTAVASRAGESMEFVGVRPYRPGDRVRDIHARTWARVGQPVVREYHQEYFTRVGVVLDTDETVATEETLEAAISLTAGVVQYLSRGEALIDLLVMGHDIHQLRLGKGLGHVEQAHELLACVKPGPALQPARLAGSIAPHLRQLSCVVVVAQAWDQNRAALVAQIRRAGTACRALLVVEPRTAAPPGELVTPVPRANIAAGGALLL